MPERKPRQRITFAQRLEQMDARIGYHQNILSALKEQRDDLLREHKAKAEAMLKEAGVE